MNKREELKGRTGRTKRDQRTSTKDIGARRGFASQQEILNEAILCEVRMFLHKLFLGSLVSPHSPKDMHGLG